MPSCIEPTVEPKEDEEAKERVEKGVGEGAATPKDARQGGFFHFNKPTSHSNKMFYQSEELLMVHRTLLATSVKGVWSSCKAPRT